MSPFCIWGNWNWEKLCDLPIGNDDIYLFFNWSNIRHLIRNHFSDMQPHICWMIFTSLACISSEWNTLTPLLAKSLSMLLSPLCSWGLLSFPLFYLFFSLSHTSVLITPMCGAPRQLSFHPSPLPTYMKYKAHDTGSEKHLLIQAHTRRAFICKNSEGL